MKIKSLNTTTCIIILSLIIFSNTLLASNSNDHSKKLMLWYDTPGKTWDDALPIGNGRLGAMIFGGIKNETIQLNENTLWAGPPIPQIKQGAYEKYIKARQQVLAGNHTKAEKIIEEKVLSERISPRSYQTLGNLHLNFKIDPAKAKNYTRNLDLKTAIAKTDFEIDGIKYTREVFCPVKEDVIIIRIYADKNRMINANIKLDRPVDFQVSAIGSDTLQMSGQASHNGKNKGTHYNCRLHAKIKGGKIDSKNNQLIIKNADLVTIYISAATDLNPENPYSPLNENLAATCNKKIAKAIPKKYTQIKENHIADHQNLFNRVSFNLPNETNSKIPTDQRLQAIKQGKDDPALIALYFHYGRYLLICSSRPSTMPANLQGLWNDKIEAPWNADYHININMQMNYWIAETCNLPDCHMPFFDFIEKLVPSGKESAKQIYQCRGFVAHHTTDPWLWTVPIGKCVYGMWPFGAGWSTQHFMEHYRFTQDKVFLQQRALPIIKEAALFFLDYLIEDPVTSKLVAGPASSPENHFITKNGEPASVDIGASMSQQIIWDTFTNYLEAAETLKIEDDFTNQIKKAKEKLALPKIASDGRIMEWSQPYKEKNPGHRHISHLYGLHPGRQFTSEHSPEYMTASRKTIEYRLNHGGGHTGWSRAWIINLWARLGDSENVYNNIQALLAKSTLNNLFDTHPPFQIDGNFGTTAGIIEALLQSHEGKINLLPALPKQWHKGSIKGLIARGNFTVDIYWENTKLKKAVITSNKGNKCKIRYNQITIEFDTQPGETITLNSSLQKI